MNAVRALFLVLERYLIKGGLKAGCRKNDDRLLCESALTTKEDSTGEDLKEL
ncbi:hypothetical protein NBRC116597_38700 [Phaeobacter sp. NW0010-22]